MKQYERVKNMSVKELAEFMNICPDNICFENCQKSTGNQFLCPHGEGVPTEKCVECIEKWLESECDSNA